MGALDGVYHAELRGGCPPSLPPSLVKPTAATIRRLCLRPVTWWEPEHHRRRPLPRLPTTHTTTHKSQSAQSASVHYPRYGSAEEESSTYPSAANRPQDSPIWNHSLATAVFCMSFPCMRAFDFLQLIIFTNHCRKPKQRQRWLFSEESSPPFPSSCLTLFPTIEIFMNLGCSQMITQMITIVIMNNHSRNESILKY